MPRGTPALLPLIALLTYIGLARAAEASRPVAEHERVALLTMSRGVELYARYGHAAMTIVDVTPGRPLDGVVYNYGYTRFDGGLIWRFLRGRARFWVALAGLDATARQYGRFGRWVKIHRLELEPAEHRRLAAMLRENRQPENRYYLYHHYDDNCATRLRDLIDGVLGGELRRRWVGVPAGDGLTFRQLTREGFAGQLGVLLLSELVLGRVVDRPLDRWQAAFLPRLLAAQLAQVKHRGRPLLSATTDVVIASTGVPPPADPLAAVKLLWALAGLLTLAALGAALGLRRRRRWAGLLLLPQALVVGLAGLLVAGLAAVAILPELRDNELLLLLWPTDLLLLWPAVRALRGRFFAGRLLRGYVLAHLVVGALVVAGHVVGLLHQQPRVWLVITLLPMLLLWLALRQLPSSPPSPSIVGEGEPAVGGTIDRDETLPR